MRWWCVSPSASCAASATVARGESGSATGRFFQFLRLREMRHRMVEPPPRHPNVVNRVSDAVSTAHKIYGIARGIYTVGKIAAPYVARAAAALV